MQQKAFLEAVARLAPLELAEDWDNVGVLLAPLRAQQIRSVLLTIDLTEAVLDEAETHGAQCVVAYHPPIFGGLKRIVPADRTSSLLLRAAEQKLLLYSPHTALDAVAGGVNDWLCEAFGPGSRTAISPQEAAGNGEVVGAGRVLELEQSTSLEQCVARTKQHLNLEHVRVATCTSPERSIKRIAICAGAGGSLLSGVDADLLLTGEMRHHDVLHRAGSGTSVILTDHTNTERGYLPRLATRLRDAAPTLAVHVAESDADPLRVV